MADNWSEYWYGTPEEISEARNRRMAELEALPGTTGERFLRAYPLPIDQRPGRTIDVPMADGGTRRRGVEANPWPPFDPRGPRVAALESLVDTGVESQGVRDSQYAAGQAGKALGQAYSAVFETSMRPRDTLIKAAQAYNAGEGWKTAELLARAPVSMMYPPAAAGTPGAPDDWRADARRLGISEGNILAIDLGTDPETYLPVPIPFMAAGKAMRTAGPLMRAARYGGRAARLMDDAGDAVRAARVAVR